MKNKQLFLLATLILAAIMSAQAADYTTYLTTQRGFTEVTSLDDIVGDAGYYYILTAAETTDLIVGIGRYEAKPDWASEETKALRYRQVDDPVADLSNFFTVEKEGDYIGFRSVIYNSDLCRDSLFCLYLLTIVTHSMLPPFKFVSEPIIISCLATALCDHKSDNDHFDAL